MSGYYSIQPRAWPGKVPRAARSIPDPYGPNGPDYAVRHLVTATELEGGMIREDIGQPITRTAADAQPVIVRSPEAPQQEPAKALATAPVPSAAPAEPRDWRKEYGLGKGL